MALFNHTYEIKGKHAEYVRKLADANVLDCRNIDIVFMSLAIGISESLKAEIDTKTEVESAKIDSEQMVRFNDNFEFYYRLLFLSDESYCPSAEERCNKVFRYIGTEKAEKDELYFTQVMLGGLEKLYFQIAENLVFTKKSNVFANKTDPFIKKDVFNYISDFLDCYD